MIYRYVSKSSGAEHLCTSTAGRQHRPTAQTTQAWPTEALTAVQSQASMNDVKNRSRWYRQLFCKYRTLKSAARGLENANTSHFRRWTTVPDTSLSVLIEISFFSFFDWLFEICPSTWPNVNKLVMLLNGPISSPKCLEFSLNNPWLAPRHLKIAILETRFWFISHNHLCKSKYLNVVKIEMVCFIIYFYWGLLWIWLCLSQTRCVCISVCIYVFVYHLMSCIGPSDLGNKINRFRVQDWRLFYFHFVVFLKGEAPPVLHVRY